MADKSGTPASASGGGGMGIAGAVGGLIGTGISAWSASRQNKKNREWSEEQQDKENYHNAYMYMVQRKHALEDYNMNNKYQEGLWDKQNAYNERIWQRDTMDADRRWQRENDYNTPMAQMARFKEAGLNPRLIYGQSNTGGSIDAASMATGGQGYTPKNTPNGPQSAGSKNYNHQMPDIDLQKGLMNYVQLKNMAVQTNNLEADTKIKEEQARNIEVDTDVKNQIFFGKMAQNRYNETIRADMEKIPGLRVKAMGLENDARAQKIAHLEKVNPESIKQMAEQLAIMQNRKLITSEELKLKQFEVKLRAAGINPSDPTWLRIIANMLLDENGNLQMPTINMFGK